jgi:thiopurine S-methyltransferase
MSPDFWLEKWQTRDIAFHQTAPNALLVRHFEKLHLAPTSRVFLPLCGKTLDIAWLLSKGYCVAGAELSEIAVQALFLELGVKAKINPVGDLKHYAGNNIDIFVGDIFDLSAAVLGRVDASYDRAALVALPEDARRQYSRHLVQLTNSAPQFLICFEYDQALMVGPPFSIDAREVSQQYGDVYQLSYIEKVEVAGGLKGVCPAHQSAWLLLNT